MSGESISLGEMGNYFALFINMKAYVMSARVPGLMRYKSGANSLNLVASP